MSLNSLNSLQFWSESCQCVLPLAHGDVQELSVGLRLPQLPSQRLDGRCGVDAREEHEEEGRKGRGLLQRGLHVEGRLLNEVLAQVVDHELRQRGADTSTRASRAMTIAMRY